MSEIHIEKNTYGLFLITSNVCHFFSDKNSGVTESIMEEMSEKLNIQIETSSNFRKKPNKIIIQHINSWKLLGVHDLAILVKSNSKLDDAIASMGKILNENISKIDVIEPNWLSSNEVIYPIFKDLINQSPIKEKKIEIYDFWCEPLIPLYINSDLNNSKNSIILYLRLNSKNKSYVDLLNEFRKNCENLPNGKILALFNGFGVFDLIIIVNFDLYSKIPQTLNYIRSCFVRDLVESCSLLCAPGEDLNGNRDLFLPFSITIKIHSWAEKPFVWEKIEFIAKKIGLSKIYIEKIDEPMRISYKQGFFDIVFIGYGNLKQFSDFCRLLDSFPFILDISTMLNLEINMSGT